jgi:hypothetical protein
MARLTQMLHLCKLYLELKFNKSKFMLGVIRSYTGLEVLEACIAASARNAPESRIGLALWLDSDGDAAHRAFATTLHR